MPFPGTTIPKLPEGFIDCSYGNDICTHYEKEWCGNIIEIWIAQDNPDRRECEHQYMVMIREPEESEAIEFIEFSKEDFSAEGLNEVSRRLKREVYKLMKKYQ